jgi:hypothetical protein
MVLVQFVPGMLGDCLVGSDTALSYELVVVGGLAVDEGECLIFAG